VNTPRWNWTTRFPST